jgi:hypothetical protein
MAPTNPRPPYQALEKGPFQDNKKSIIAKAVKIQKSGKFGKYKIGESTDWPTKPEKWLLYSSEKPPQISRETFYDPTGVKEFPAFVYLDDQCAAMVQESGTSQKIKLNTWPGNFLSTVTTPECGHWGRPAVGLTGSSSQVEATWDGGMAHLQWAYYRVPAASQAAQPRGTYPYHQ